MTEYTSPIPELLAIIHKGLDNEERIALAAGGAEWLMMDNDESSVYTEDGTTVVYDEGAPSRAEAEHIAFQDPRMTLKRIAATRKVVEAEIDNLESFESECSTPNRDDIVTGRSGADSDILAELARLYSDDETVDAIYAQVRTARMAIVEMWEKAAQAGAAERECVHSAMLKGLLERFGELSTDNVSHETSQGDDCEELPVAGLSKIIANGDVLRQNLDISSRWYPR